MNTNEEKMLQETECVKKVSNPAGLDQSHTSTISAHDSNSASMKNAVKSTKTHGSNTDFVHLHVHTDYSTLDGLGTTNQYVKRCKELGMKALAFTDHGTMSGLVTAFDECEKQGIKFIGGFEAYTAPHGKLCTDKSNTPGEKPYNHLVILFKNEIGYKNGCYLVTHSNTDGFYYKPRIDFEMLKKHSEGLIILSACLAGAVPKAILAGDYENAKKIVMDYKEVFGDDYYLEIQDHNLKEDVPVITDILRLSKECGVKVVATNDCHYVNLEDKEAHQWLVCMQTDKKITDANYMAYSGDYHLKSKEEMLELFPYCEEAIYNTMEIVDKCNFKFEYGNYRMPKVVIPEKYGTDYYAYLEDEAWKGYEKRYPIGHKKRNEANNRLKYELGIIKQMNFAEYFLDIRKTIRWAKDNGILVGPGRGSGAGSCMNYCLEITDIEPLQYDLLFERFLNPERVSMPDIDTDFDYMRKNDIVAEEAETNGKDCFAKIRTFQTMKAKAVIKGCTKVSGIENHVAIGNKLAKFITDNHSLQEEWDINSELRDYVNSDKRLQKIWDISLKLENTKKSTGTHACGHIPTPVPCEDLFPCGVDSETGYLVCEYDMTQAEHLGNLKKDLLMLRNLTIIETAQKEILKRTGRKIPLWTEEILNDKKALEMVSRGETDGVFQLESDGMKRFMKQLQPSCFEDIIAGVALYRPGPMDYIPDYVRNKHNPKDIHYPTPESEEILAPTYGIIVYQEQVMLLVQKLAGFSMGRADVVRKAMGKKKQDIMDQEKPHFIFGDKDLGIKGCVNNGISQGVAENIWSQMEDFAKYAFNKSHAAAYAAISMQTAYLKANYPIEFAAGLLASVMDDSDKLMKYINSFKSINIDVLPPDVQKSEDTFSIEDTENGECIRFGLAAIKGVGEGASKIIPKKRPTNGYENLEDFIDTHYSLNKGAIDNLIKCGALDSFGYNRHTLETNMDKLIATIKKSKKNADENQLSLFDIGLEGVKLSYDITEVPEYSFLQLCRKEKEALGLYLSGHPADAIDKDAKKHGSIDIEDILREDTLIENNESVFVSGVITNIKRTVTKKNSPMMIIDLEDTTGVISILVFDKMMQKYADELQEDNLIFIKGKVRGGGEDSSLMLEDVCQLNDIPSILWIATNDVTLTHLRKNANNFKTKAGGFGNYLYIMSYVTRKPECLGEIYISPSLIERAKISFGSDNVKITQKKIN